MNKRLAISMAVLLLAAGCACGAGSPALDDAALRTAWANNISNTAAIRTAIEECSKKYGGKLSDNCDSFSDLKRNGFRAVFVATREVDHATIGEGTAVVFLYGRDEVNGCVLKMTPTVTKTGVTWAYTIFSRSSSVRMREKCDRTTTGIGT